LGSEHAQQAGRFEVMPPTLRFVEMIAGNAQVPLIVTILRQIFELSFPGA
jgi:hypothetical protein